MVIVDNVLQSMSVHYDGTPHYNHNSEQQMFMSEQLERRQWVRDNGSRKCCDN